MGIDSRRFVDVNPDLICAICQDVLEDPGETPCRHVFCSACIIGWVNRSIARENSCPTCRAKVSHWDIRPALSIVRRLLRKQKMYCDALDKGCKKILTMDKMRGHLQACPYSAVQCRHEWCGTTILRKNRKEHERSCKRKNAVTLKKCSGQQNDDNQYIANGRKRRVADKQKQPVKKRKTTSSSRRHMVGTLDHDNKGHKVKSQIKTKD